MQFVYMIYYVLFMLTAFRMLILCIEGYWNRMREGGRNSVSVYVFV